MATETETFQNAKSSFMAPFQAGVRPMQYTMPSQYSSAPSVPMSAPYQLPQNNVTQAMPAPTSQAVNNVIKMDVKLDGQVFKSAVIDAVETNNNEQIQTSISNERG